MLLLYNEVTKIRGQSVTDIVFKDSEVEAKVMDDIFQQELLRV